MHSVSFQHASELIATLIPRSGQSGDVDAMCQRIIQSAQLLFEAHMCVFVAYNPETHERHSLLTSGALHNDEWQIAELQGVFDLAPQFDNTEEYLWVESLDDQAAQHPLARRERLQSFMTMSLYAQSSGIYLGTLTIGYRQQQSFDRARRNLVRMFTVQAGTVLQQSWLLFRYNAVTQIAQAINQNLSSVDTLFQQLYLHIGNIIDVRCGFLLAVYQRETQLLDFYLMENGLAFTSLGQPLAGGSAWVIEHRRPLLIYHRSEETEQLPTQLQHVAGSTTNVESLLFVPLLVGELCLGALSVQHPVPEFFDDEDRQVMLLLASHVALALHNLRLFESLRSLNHVGQRLTQQLNSDEVLRLIVEEIRSITRADLVVLYPYLAPSDQFAPMRTSGDLVMPDHLHEDAPRADDIARLVVRQTEAVYALHATELYTLLGGEPGERRGGFAEREQIATSVALPLLVRDEAVGALFLNFRSPQQFDAPQRQLIESLDTYAAIAILNSRTYEHVTQRRLHELETLQQIDRALASTLDLQTTLQIILELAGKHITAFKIAIFLYNPQLKALETRAMHCPDPSHEQALVLPEQERQGIVWQVFELRRPARVDNVLTDPTWSQHYVAAMHLVMSELDVPLLDGEQAIGVINFESVQEAAFSADDEKFAVTLAGQAVLAIKNAQLYEQARRDAEERQAIINVSSNMIGQLELQRVFEQILEQALRVTNSDCGTLHLYNSELQTLEMVAERGVQAINRSGQLRLGEGVVGFVAQQRTPLKVADVREPPWNKVHIPDIPLVRSELAVPMLEGNELRGVINIEHQTPDFFDARAERLLKALADLAVIAIQNARENLLRVDAERRMREAEVMSSIGQASMELTHRLGNDLGPIIPAVNAIRNELERLGIENPTIIKQLDRIVHDKTRVTDLASSLRDELILANRASAANAEHDILSVSELLEETARSLPDLPATIRLVIEDSSAVAPIRGSYRQISNILRNLFVNAVEAMPNGGTLTMRAHNAPQSVVIEVCDTGNGISHEQQSRIFDLFYSTKGSFGFGLWSARRDTLANGGDLTVESRPGSGTTFSLSLPRAKMPHGATP